MIAAPWKLPVLFVTGLVAGFVDAIAGGGGLLTVPALLGVGLPPQIALGTNKLQSSFGTALATWNYSRAGLLHWRPLLPGIAITFTAGLAGAAAVSRLDPSVLRPLIPVLLLGIAAYLAWKPDLGAQARPARLRPIPFLLVFGSTLGFYDGFFGPGTGSFWMMACVLMLGLDLRSATGHTKVMNLSSNLASLAWFISLRSVDYQAGLVMAGGQLIGAHFGSRLAIRRGAGLIRPLFLGVVVLLATKLLWDFFRA
jgi:uncharacterized membrane protein YfcA